MFIVTDSEPRLFGEQLAQDEQPSEPIVVDEIDDTDDAEQLAREYSTFDGPQWDNDGNPIWE
jgi:hypothetical protein